MGTDIDNLKLLLKNCVKIYNIEYTDKEVKIGVIRGVDITSMQPEVLVTNCNVKKTSDIENLLASDIVKQKIYNPINRGIILVDIVGYSKGDTLMQGVYLQIFQNAINRTLSFLEIYTKGKFVEQIVASGDGCYIIFNEELNDRFFKVVFGIISQFHVLQNQVLKEFSRSFKEGDRIKLRIGCVIGETDFFTDLSGNRNCFGTGMNEAARILSCGEKEAKKIHSDEVTDITENTIFIGESVYPQSNQIILWLTNNLNQKCYLDELGNLEDKHGTKRKVWWMRGLSLYFALNLFSPEDLYENKFQNLKV